MQMYVHVQLLAKLSNHWKMLSFGNNNYMYLTTMVSNASMKEMTSER